MGAKYRRTLPQELLKVLVLTPVLLLAACGQTTNSIGTAGGTAVGSTSTVVPTVLPKVGTSTGCPAATQVVYWPSPPAVTITSADAPHGATVKVGESLEVALAFGSRWSLSNNAGAPELNLSQPAGYGDASVKSCIWRFTAKQPGLVRLSFEFAPICKAHQECPQFIGLLDVPITVMQ